MSDDLQTVSPDQIAVAATPAEDAFVLIQSPGGAIQKTPYQQLLAKLIATDLIFADEITLQADLAHEEDTVALVNNDPDPLTNGWWRKVGASGAGNWEQFEQLAKAIRDAVEVLKNDAKAWAETASATAGDLDGKLDALNISFPEQPCYALNWPNSLVLVATDLADQVVWAVDVDGRMLMNSGHSMTDISLAANGALKSALAALLAVESDFLWPVTDAADNLLGGWRKSGAYAGRFDFAFTPLVNGRPISARPLSGAASTDYVVFSYADGSGLLQLRVERRSTGAITFQTGAGNNFMPSLSEDGMLVFTSDAASGFDEVVFASADGSGEITPVTSRSTLVVLMGDSNSSDVEGYYPQFAAIASGRTSFMAGWSRQTTPQIAARQNGIPCTITVSGNSIPGSGTATITAMSTRFLSQAGLAVAKQMDVRVNGVDCTIYKDAGSYTNPATYADVYTIGRKVAGGAVAVAAGTPVYTINGINNRVGTQIMWPGRNDGAAALMSVTKPGVQAMIAYLSPLSKHYLIFGIVPSGYPTTAEIYGTTPHTQIRAYNDDMLATYGNAMDATHSGRFFDIHTYFVNRAAGTSQCMTDAGLTPTADDLTDIANGIPPRQIVTQDTTGFHFTVAARQQVAARILEILAAKGW